MKHLNVFTKSSLYALTLAGLVFTGCKKDDEDAPEPENELEVITDVTLVFTNTENSDDVVKASAKDPDGAGIDELVINDTINLDTSKTYKLTFEIFSNLEAPGEDIGEEILEEADEHQIFFAFTDNSYASPSGDGNVGDGKGNDQVNYIDKDGNQNNLGLETEWTTPNTVTDGGKFRVILKHQPDIKTSSSDSEDGDTDCDVEFVLNRQ